MSDAKRAVTLYHTLQTLEEKEAVINWVLENIKTSNDLKFKITGYRLLGDFAVEKNNFHLARQYFQQGIALIDPQTLKLKDSDISIYDGSVLLDIYDQLGVLYFNLGNVQEALFQIDKSISVKSTYFGEKHPVCANSRIEKASIYFQTGNYNAALELFEKSIYDILVARSTKFNQEKLVKAYITMARIQHSRNESKKAIKNVRLAKDFSSGVNGAVSQLYLTEILLAKIYMDINDLDKAEKWIERAENSYDKVYSRELNHYTYIQKVKAEYYFRLKDNEKAFFELENLMDNHIKFIEKNFNYLSEIEKEKFYDKITNDLNDFYTKLFDVYNRTKNIELLKSIFDRRVKTKGFLLNDQYKIKRRILNSSDPNLKQEMKNWQNGKEALAYFLYNNQEGSSYKIDSINKQISQSEKILSERTNLMESAQMSISIKDVQNSLLPNEVAIEIIRYVRDNQVVYAALIIPARDQAIDATFLELNKDDEERFVKFYKSSINFEITDNSSYSSFWSFIDQKIAGVKKIYFSADGLFNQINIYTILDSELNTYIIDKYQLVYISNLKDLTEKETRKTSKTAYLFGRPQYDQETIKEEKTLEINDELRSSLNMSLNDFQNQDFSDLPGTELEIQNIENILIQNKWVSNSFLGPEATEEAIKSIEDADIVHIATHGFFIQSSTNVNPLIKSGLVMAGVKNNGGVLDDGILTAYEVTNLNLDNTWLVVLSACDTGVGDIKYGEGVYGLQRALIVAGASNLIMSLWKVDDKATKDLMISLYKNISEGFEIEIAFRNAQLEIRKKYNQPKYWGSFILVKAKF